MNDAPTVADLIADATRGEQGAWNALVDRYMPLVYSVIRGYRMGDADAQDVSQTLWLRLVEHLTDIREPRALPAWIVTTTRHEAVRVLKSHGRMLPVDPLTNGLEPQDVEPDDLDQDLTRAERHQVLRDGLAELTPQDRELIDLLIADPPVPYLEISRRLGIPIGSIGPTRARCLNKLRMTPVVRGYLAAESDLDDTGGDRDGLARVGC